MARVLVEKKVLFSGIWRPRHSLDDGFLRTVSQQFLEKPGARSIWRLTNEGLTILVSQSESGRQGQTDQIPVTAIKDVTVNRYNALCLMTPYFDPNDRFSVIVCKCDTEQDASEIVSVFRKLQKSLSGEGYRIDLKQPRGMNWTLTTKQNGDPYVINGHEAGLSSKRSSIRSQGSSVSPGYFGHNNNHGELVVEMEEETLEREELEVEGRHLYNVGVQAELGEDDSDRESTASDISMQSLKEELHSLSSEVREMKTLFERATGISTEEYFRRMHSEPTSPRFVPVKRMVSTESEGSNNGEKRVNFAEGDDLEFDIRSIGMQTEGRSRGKYIKRVRGGSVPAHYKQGPYRGRPAGSVVSTSHSPAMSPAGSYDASHFAHLNHGARVVDMRQDPRYRGGSLPRGVMLPGGNMRRPIESVYNVHTPGFHHKRKQFVVMSQRAATMPVRRASSERRTAPTAGEASKPPARTGNDVAAKPQPLAAATAAGNAVSGKGQ